MQMSVTARRQRIQKLGVKACMGQCSVDSTTRRFSDSYFQKLGLNGEMSTLRQYQDSTKQNPFSGSSRKVNAKSKNM